MSRRFPAGRSERGAVAIVAAVMASVLLVMAGLVIDLGLARETRRISQVAADSSALAGANVLYPTSNNCSSPSGTHSPCITDAIAAVKSYASLNYNVTTADWTSCTDPSFPSGYVAASDTPCISFDSSTAPRRVRVYIPKRLVPTSFGSLVGVQSVQVRANAEASLAPGQKCALCFLGSVTTNNTDFSVVNASIAVDGNVTSGPQSNWTGTTIGVAGTVSGGNFTPAATKISTFSDPLASLSLPLSTTGFSNRTDPCASVAGGGGQGIYGSFSLPNSTCTMQPGIYVITGTWDMKNNTKLMGTGVTLYVKTTGVLDFKNGDVVITAPTSGATSGYAVIYDRDNSSDIQLQGNGNTSIDGAFYAPAATFKFNGNSCFGIKTGPVVALAADSVGNKSCIAVTNATEVTVGVGSIALDQ